MLKNKKLIAIIVFVVLVVITIAVVVTTPSGGNNDKEKESGKRVTDGYETYSVLIPEGWSAEGHYEEIIIYDRASYEEARTDSSATRLHFFYEPKDVGYTDASAKAKRDERLAWYTSITNTYKIGQDMKIGDVAFYIFTHTDTVTDVKEYYLHGQIGGADLTIYLESPENNQIANESIQNIIKSIKLIEKDNSEEE